ncbi:hypothetical protein MYCSP_04190 [Mycobacteroides saopaulense]|nr:hypothetical protein MYCSP_04190 [Mycobacteroides saopaulense]
MEAAVDAFCAGSFDELTAAEALAVLARLEVGQRRLASRGLGLIPAVTGQASPVQLGGTSFPDVVSRRLHISKGAARRRIADAELLAPRRALTGEVLAPVLPNVAGALERGDAGEEHVRIIRQFFDRLPVVVDTPTREAAEAQLAVMATQFRPEQLRTGAERLMALLNPDGQFSDADRARRRGIVIGQQGFDGMSAISGLLDPQTRAYLDAVFSKLAAPGMCNPTDHTPLVDGEPADDAAERDTRTVAQRHHDALRATLRAPLACAELGSHHGLPVTVIVTTTLTELEDTAGIATTDQRIVLHAKDRGCTHPGCPVPGYLCEVHHIDEWTHDGPTNIDNLTFACGPHHRLLNQSWITRKHKDGTTEWIPPPQQEMGALELPGQAGHDDAVHQRPDGVGCR